MSEKNNTEQGQASAGAPSVTTDDKNVIDPKTAEAEFVRYCEANNIDCDTNGMTDDEKEDFEPIKKRFVKACKQGRVKVNGTDLIYIVSNFSPNNYKGQEITIKRPGGSSFMSMDNYKETQNVHKMNGFMADMTGQEKIFFSKIDGSDWAFFRDIATLFLVD